MATQIDCMGQACPIPVIKTLKALVELAGPGEVETLVDNKPAVENLKRMATSKGCTATEEQLGEKQWKVTVTTEAAVESENAEAEAAQHCDVPAGPRKVVVQLASATMGIGSDELGAKLIKGFIFSLTQLPELPDTILLYNGGAALSCEGSASLEDLKNLEAAGVKVLTCGTCLDHYGLTDKLAVGEITNMYVIAETLTGASVVVRP